jgi:hypothetical protein
VCISALLIFPVAGCSDSTGGTGGIGGAGGIGGTGGAGGAGGIGGGDSAWALSVGAVSTDRGNGVAAFADGSFVATGSFQETATFGADEVNETALVSAGGTDVFVARYETPGGLVWAKRAGGGGAEGGSVIASFADGSSVVSGTFDAAATFGPGEDHETELSSDGLADLFVARYDSDGALVWARRAGGLGNEFNRGLASLPDGSSIMTGAFEGTATFGPGEGNETELSSDGLPDVFVARYDAFGYLIWAKKAGGELSDIANAMASFADGSSIVTGRFEGTASFGSGETNETELTSVGSRDIFVARYNADGTLAWTKRAGGLDSDQSWGVTTFADGSSIVTGSFVGTATFGLGEPNMTELTSPGGYDLFIARYDSNGMLAWAKRAGGADSAVGRDIGRMADGSVVVTGRFEGAATFGPGEPGEAMLTAGGEQSNVFIAHYAASGELRWATSAGGPNSVTGSAIVSLPDDSIVVTGSFLETATFHGGTADETVLTSKGDRDIFVARYKVNGM